MISAANVMMNEETRVRTFCGSLEAHVEFLPVLAVSLVRGREGVERERTLWKAIVSKLHGRGKGGKYELLSFTSVTS